MNARPDSPPLPVLAHFAPHTRGLAWCPAPDGFSGAGVWCGVADGVPRVALKAWPVGVSPDRVRHVHAWLAGAAHLPFVPTVFSGVGGRTVVAEAGRVWDCGRWMPGAPVALPTVADVRTACAAVTRLHRAWANTTEFGPCPGVRNRLRALAENESLLRAGPDALPPVSPHLDHLLRHAVAVAGRAAPLARRALEPWEGRAFTLHPCVRDLRADHVLFENGDVRGIIDYGACAIDHPAVDLARLLGDLAGDDDSLFEAGVAAYRDERGAVEVSAEFVRVLARTGLVGSVLGWLVRLVVRREILADPHAVAARLAVLLSRAERVLRF